MQIPTQLMAGVADDIINVSGLPLFDLADRGFAIDLLPLMQNDPDFNEDDYFMHVIDAFKYRGRLHAFPMHFAYTLIGINTFNLDKVNSRNSEEIIERFRQLETISYRQMLDLYIGLEDRDGLYVSLDANALDHIISSLSIFIDFENNTANFYSDEFIRILSDWREVTDPLLIAGGRLPISRSGSFTGVDREAQIERASRYLFAAYGMGLSYDVFFPHAEQELFTHFIPLATCDGEILIGTGRDFFINSASDNVELAWEFLKFLATDMYVYNRFPLGIPTNRDKFRNTLAQPISNAVGVWTREERLFDVGDIDELTESIYERVSVFNEMPMRHSAEFWGAHSVMIEEIITSFYHGVLTAEQAALELQNRISIYLMERG
jgi:ABC-type glycerol-3-phosphate transport system substrate-binding protein